jgi:MFS transporter, DHA1 family, inner membrane transport protein
MESPRATGATLALALGASQAAILALTPVLADVARDLDVSTATAGQLRTISGLAAGVTALGVGLAATRVGLRGLVGVGLALLATGSALSAVAPAFAVLGVGQLLIGAGCGLSYTAAIAAVAEWSSPGERSRVLAIALLGPPAAWVVGMPVCGLVGEVSWRLTWVVVPLAGALAALLVLLRRPSTPPARSAASLRAVFREPGVLRWSAGELLAFSAWAGALVYVGALFIESYGLSVGATGLVLGAGALVYLPGNLLFRRLVDDHLRALLVGTPLAAAVAVVVLGAVRPSAWLSFVAFGTLAFIAGGRTLAGSAAALDLAPELRLGVTGVRTGALQGGYFVGAAVGGAALALGGYAALGLTMALLFAGAAVPHLLPARPGSPQPQLP